MTDLYKQLANLSPEKRRLLETLLKEQGVDLARTMIIPQPRDTNAFPLSFAQQRLWFLDQLSPGSATYNIPMAARLLGVLDMGALERALNEIVRRHEILRTSFAAIDGQPMQIIKPHLPLTVPLDDLRDVTASEREAEAMRRANDEARLPFDLTRGPLFRVRLLRLADDDHIVLLAMHHIIADGWSMNVILQELAALYSTFVVGKSSPLPELPIQYADYAGWQQHYLTGEIRQGQIAFWKEQLAGIPAKLELPTDRPRPPAQSYRGASRAFDLPRSAIESLRALSQRENATLFMTLLAAFHVLLHRYSGQDDICVGTPIANRHRAEIENLIGFFVNTLVLRGDLSGAPTFRELLKRVRETAMRAYAHQDVPFEMLVDELHPQRDESYAPLFQVMFALQTISRTTFHLPQITITSLPAHSGTTKFDLTFALTEDSNGVSGVIEYSTDLFDATTIARMAGHYQTLLESVAANPDLPIIHYQLLTPVEQHQLLVEWNDTAADYARDVCAHQLFEIQVEENPAAVAVVYENTQLTFRELNCRANQLARVLIKQGVGPDTLVGLCVERSVEMIVGVLGILKAGGAYVPLDPSYPAERLAFMLQDSRAPVLLTRSYLLSRDTQSISRNTLYLDSDWDTIAQEDDTNPSSDVTPENLAYVIYTSGSTGRPKGVMIQHQSVLNLLTGLEHAIYNHHPQRPKRVSVNAPLSFDASVQELVMLLRGHTLYIIPQETRLDARALKNFVREHRLDVLDCVPTQLKLLLAEGLFDGAGWAPSIVLPGGEAIDETTWQMLAQIKQTDFYNMYGPTECTVDSTICHVRADLPPSIGRPVVNVQHYILDSHLQPAPIGVPGELHIGGADLARGYLNRPELTAEKFINCKLPIANCQLPIRVYKTGDLTRYLPDGNIEFLGRMDQQIKIRGFRVELNEIEATLAQHALVKQVVVVAREQAGDKRIVAYIVPTTEQPPAANDLREFLHAKLPDYMIPAAFVLLDALPLLPNGKVDRRALPAPELTADVRAFIAPRTPTEEILANIWAPVLGVTRVGICDNFFDLGGHSLLATQLVSRVRDAFKIELPLRALFESPTLAEFARQVERAQHVSAPPIQRVPRESALPLSFAQQRLWFLDQLEPNSAVYNIPSAVRITGSLDLAVFERAVNEIIRRHEILRTTCTMTDGQPHQVISPELKLTLPVIDVRDLPEAFQLATEESRRPFDLARGPLIRVQLLRLRADDHIVLWTMHHIISDGWSSGVLMREVAELYAAFAAGKPSPLSQLEIQYADFAAWQRAWLSGETLGEQLAFWKQQLTLAPPSLELPTDHPRPAMQTNVGAHQSFALSQDVSDALVRLSRQENATLFMTLLAAFQILLHRYSSQDDICIGTPIANRNRAEIENLIGLFVNTLVLRGDVSGNPGFRELLKRVRAVTLDAYAHQDVPFEMIVDALQPKRDLSYTPLFQVMFTLQNAADKTVAIPGLTFDPLDIESGLAMFDLTLTLTETPDGLLGNFEFNTDLFDAATIARMIEHFQTLVAGIVTNPDQPISALSMLSDNEQHQLVAWNNTAAEFSQGRDQCMHQIFQAQAARTPDAVAVRCAGESLTYRELNRRANQLAHYLQNLGVQPDTLVGICVERSLDMIVGLLGILKSGGAYLPLDPAYPPERLAFMLQDSGALFVLTQAQFVERFRHSLCLDTSWDEIARENASNVENGVTPNHLAYVIYTSGSTGQPKGVMVEHRSVVNHNLATARAFGLEASDRVLQFATINFDAAIEEIFPAWSVGATVVLRPAGAIPSGAELSRLIETEQITVLDLPTAYWHTWVFELSLANARVPQCVRMLVLGGEKAMAERMAQWQKLGGADMRWLNTYGPTEGTIIATLYDPAGDPEKLDGRNIPIGKPIANAQIHLLDKYLQPVPIGVPGELHIGGVCVARGYLNRPDLTAEKFVHYQLPITNRQSPTRLYKTGDLARYRADGNIEFLGRADNQVKVRGFRVELGEIETALDQHPAVKQAAVIAHNENDVNRLIAYVALTTDHRPPTTELREFLQSKLPDYMVPSAFVVLDALPMLPSGKVDRRALPELDVTRVEPPAEYIAPRAHTEEILANIWAQVLGGARVGVHDNFFELGGDSILAIQVIARANQAGVSLTPKHLFQYPTIAQLAAVAGTARAIHAEQGIVTGAVPLTPIQHWFFEQNFAAPHHWNQSLLFQVQEPLQRESLEQAIAALLAHHDALRMRFTRDESGWHATNANVEARAPIAWIDLREEAEPSRILETRAAELQASLNLAEGPLLRAAYFDLGTERAGRLLLIAHHLIVDGVSWRIVLEDLLTAYTQARRGERVQLPTKTTAFQYWARRLNEYAQSDAVREELAYWFRRDDRAGRLPIDLAGKNVESSAQSITVSLDADETRALLHDVPTAYRTEINDALLTALAQALARWTGSRTVIVDLEGHGREDLFDDVDVSRTVGWFTSVYPVRLAVSERASPGDALKAIKEQVRRVPQRGIGYGLLRYLKDDPSIAESMRALAQPEITFNYLGQTDQALAATPLFDFAPESSGAAHSPRGSRTHLLDINGGVADGQLRIEWTYSANIHRRETIERVADHLIEALRAIIRECRSATGSSFTPSDFPLAQLDQRQLDKVLGKVGRARERALP